MSAKLGAVTVGLLLIGLSMVHAHDFSEAVAQARASGGGQAEEDIAKMDNEDHNGKISLEEFKAYIYGHNSTEIAHELEISPEHMQRLNVMVDSNQDGDLTEQEINEFYAESLDTNGDNGVDKNELDDFKNSITEPADYL